MGTGHLFSLLPSLLSLFRLFVFLFSTPSIYSFSWLIGKASSARTMPFISISPSVQEVNCSHTTYPEELPGSFLSFLFFFL